MIILKDLFRAKSRIEIAEDARRDAL